MRSVDGDNVSTSVYTILKTIHYQSINNNISQFLAFLFSFLISKRKLHFRFCLSVKSRKWKMDIHVPFSVFFSFSVKSKITVYTRTLYCRPRRSVCEAGDRCDEILAQPA